MGLVAGISLFAAALSYFTIEMPFRRKWLLPTASKMLIGAGISLLFTTSACAFLLRSILAPGKSEQRAAELAKIKDDSLAYRPDFQKDPDRIREDPLPVIGANGRDPMFVIWGDSHALSILPAVDLVCKRLGISGVYCGSLGSAPLLGVDRVEKGSQRFLQRNNAVIERLENGQKFAFALLVARWSLYTEQTFYGQKDKTPPEFEIDGQTVSGKVALTKGLCSTIQALNRLGMRVYLLEQVPEVGWNVPNLLERAAKLNLPPPKPPTLAEYSDRQKETMAVFFDISRVFPVGIKKIHDDLFVNGSLRVEQGGRYVYRDNDHLGNLGREIIEPALERVLNDACSDTSIRPVDFRP
jgi:hypothetical protein